MKYRVPIVLAVLGLALAPARAATPLFVTPDVPTLTAGGTTLLPWQIFRYDAAGPTYLLEVTVPGQPNLDAVHKLDQPGSWLFSVEAPSDLGGSLVAPALPGDVVRYDGDSDSYEPFFCATPVGIPPGVNIDALFTVGDDDGDLIVSFEVPVELPAGAGVYYEPSDLVRFERVGDGCGAWTLSDANPFFDASSAGAGVPLAANVTGADDSGSGTPIFSTEVPADLSPSAGPTTYVRGQIGSWDGAVFDLFETLDGWPAGSVVAGLSCQANPGRIDPARGQLLLGKAPAGQLDLSWSTTCASGADDYGIYEGTCAALSAGLYDHAPIVCNDTAPFLSETIVPGDGDRYYLVVPRNDKSEGSYGTTSAGIERPPAGEGGCSAVQSLTSCPAR